MSPPASSSLLAFALLVSGLVAGWNSARADELPADTNMIERLTPEQARQLAEEFPGVDMELEFNHGRKVHCSKCLPLNGLTSLDRETAQALAGYDKGPLALNGLTTLDAAAAEAIAGFKGAYFSLRGLTTLDAAVAKGLARFEGNVLYLHGLTALDAAAAQELARFNGKVLYLDGLTTLDAAAAEPLAKFKGTLLELGGLEAVDAAAAGALVGFGSDRPGRILKLDGLTAIDPATAQALAASKAWLGQLPRLTAFEAPDSVAVAQALATRKGRLALPNLRKISPKTLTALIEKRDVEIPLVETLDLIPEPDGSGNDDFVIPEWLEEREAQRREQERDRAKLTPG